MHRISVKSLFQVPFFLKHNNTVVLAGIDVVDKTKSILDVVKYIFRPYRSDSLRESDNYIF